MEYCIIRRSLECTPDGDVFAVRNIWDATPPGVKRTRDVLDSVAKQLNQGASDVHTDYVVCEGSFASVLDSFN